MKTSWTQRTLVAIAFFAAQSGFANVSGGVNPGYVKVKMYGAQVSRSADCSNPIPVFTNNSPDYQDVTHNPTLGAGSIPDGTYNCIMLRISDFIHYTPATADPGWTHGVCNVGTDSYSDVGHDETAVDPDGTTHALGAKGTESKVWLYIRTGAVLPGGGGAQSTFAPTGGIPLLSPLVVHGDTTHTMVFNFDGLIGEEQDAGVWHCDCDAPTLEFR